MEDDVRQTPMTDKKVFVYRNLVLQKFAIRDLNSGRETYADEVWLANASFVVDKGGWHWAIREGRRCIHAGIVGNRLEDPPRGPRCEVAVRYHPQLNPYFVDEDGQPVHNATLVHMIAGLTYIPRQARWL